MFTSIDFKIQSRRYVHMEPSPGSHKIKKTTTLHPKWSNQNFRQLGWLLKNRIGNQVPDIGTNGWPLVNVFLKWTVVVADKRFHADTCDVPVAFPSASLSVTRHGVRALCFFLRASSRASTWPWRISILTRYEFMGHLFVSRGAAVSGRNAVPEGTIVLLINWHQRVSKACFSRPSYLFLLFCSIS